MPKPPLPQLQGSLDLLVLGALSSGATHGYGVATLVRERSGGMLEQANAALRVIQAQITEGASRQLQPFTLATAATGNSPLRSRFETPLLAMVVAVGLVLLVACANIASLMLARTLARRREFSVRLALGSSRWRIARLLFTESLLVAVTGEAVGLVFASWSSALLVQQLSTWQSTVSLDLAPDWRSSPHSSARSRCYWRPSASTGVVANAVCARQREIGLRIALGATPSSILRLVFERVGWLIAAGLALGLVGSLWAARFVEVLLFQLAPRDPVTFGGAAAVLVAVGVLAAWLPAHRAARLDPATVVREG